MEGVGRGIDHAGKQLDAFQLPECRVRQHGLDRGPQALVIDRPGEAAGEAAALALEGSVALDRVDVGKLQARLRERGADPGDRPAANATVLRAAE